MATSPESQLNPEGKVHGDIITQISDGLVRLLKDNYGVGPSETKTTYEGDLVLCVLRGGFTRIEQTLIENGRDEMVISLRQTFQSVMASRFQSVVETATGRRVMGFMSGNQTDPDMLGEIFVLEPRDS